MKAKAAVLVEQNKPLVIDEIEIPELRFGQVLVKVICSGICGSQLGEIKGAKGPDKFLPHLLGHEATGIVVDCGEGVTTVKKNDKVVMHWRPGTGIQAQPPKYHSEKLGVINAGYITTFNEYAVVSENRITTVPDDTDPEIGALMGCAVLTGVGVVNNNAKIKIGESVVVWGAGGIGLNIIQGAAMVSAIPIIAIDLYDNKLELAKKMGATHIINAKNQDVESEIDKILDGQKADVVVDNTGNAEIIGRAYNLTSAKGRTILVGVPPKGHEAKIYTLPLHFEKTISGSHGGEAHPEIDIPNYMKLVDSGGMDLKSLISKHYSLDEINNALDDMRNGVFPGRCIININK